MVTEVKTESGENGDPVLAQFIELRKYIERSHDGLAKRLDTVEVRLGNVEAGQQRLERRVDTGFDQLGRKIDALASARRVTRRRRKP